MHYIRTSIVENLILNAIKSVANYARLIEEEFLEKMRQCSNIQAESAVKESKAQLARMTRRRDEIFKLIKKLYENYALEKITETNFAELLTDYNTEQKNLDYEISRIQSEIEGADNSTINHDKFLALVNRFTNFDTYSATLTNITFLTPYSKKELAKILANKAAAKPVEEAVNSVQEREDS
jgi:tRNA nucleotidyltransferase/poly(A) polymerase